MGDRMDEQTIVRVLIFNGFTGLRNQLRRLVDTDNWTHNAYDAASHLT